MGFDHAHEYPSLVRRSSRFAEKPSITRETLRLWVRRAETDAGQRTWVTPDDRARIKDLEREDRELRLPGSQSGSTPYSLRLPFIKFGSLDEDARQPSMAL